MWDVLLLRIHLGLVLPKSSCIRGFTDVQVLQEEQGPPALVVHLTAGSKGLCLFGKKGIIASPSCFSQPIPELERASDTQALHKLTGTAFDPSFLDFPTAVRAEPGRVQRPHRGCSLDSSLTAHLSFGAAAKHFVS